MTSSMEPIAPIAGAAPQPPIERLPVVPKEKIPSIAHIAMDHFKPHEAPPEIAKPVSLTSPPPKTNELFRKSYSGWEWAPRFLVDLFIGLIAHPEPGDVVPAHIAIHLKPEALKIIDPESFKLLHWEDIRYLNLEQLKFVVPHLSKAQIDGLALTQLKAILNDPQEMDLLSYESLGVIKTHYDDLTPSEQHAVQAEREKILTNYIQKDLIPEKLRNLNVRNPDDLNLFLEWVELGLIASFSDEQFVALPNEFIDYLFYNDPKQHFLSKLGNHASKPIIKVPVGKNERKKEYINKLLALQLTPQQFLDSLDLLVDFRDVEIRAIPIKYLEAFIGHPEKVPMLGLKIQYLTTAQEFALQDSRFRGLTAEQIGVLSLPFVNSLNIDSLSLSECEAILKRDSSSFRIDSNLRRRILERYAQEGIDPWTRYPLFFSADELRTLLKDRTLEFHDSEEPRFSVQQLQPDCLSSTIIRDTLGPNAARTLVRHHLGELNIDQINALLAKPNLMLSEQEKIGLERRQIELQGIPEGTRIDKDTFQRFAQHLNQLSHSRQIEIVLKCWKFLTQEDYRRIEPTTMRAITKFIIEEQVSQDPKEELNIRRMRYRLPIPGIYSWNQEMIKRCDLNLCPIRFFESLNSQQISYLKPSDFNSDNKIEKLRALADIRSLPDIIVVLLSPGDWELLNRVDPRRYAILKGKHASVIRQLTKATLPGPRDHTGYENIRLDYSEFDRLWKEAQGRSYEGNDGKIHFELDDAKAIILSHVPPRSLPLRIALAKATTFEGFGDAEHSYNPFLNPFQPATFAQGDYCASMHSSFMVDGGERRRAVNPITDAMRFVSYHEKKGPGEVFIMTGVDSDVQNALADQEKEMSEEAKKAARTLCKTIENHLTCHLEEKGIENERELAALLIDGLSSCKEALNASKVEGASMMTVVGKKDPVTRKVSCMAASVGDLSLRILRKNGDVEKMNARTWAATSFARPSDSGGSITPLRMDLRNLELIRFELEEGDTLLMNTDGPEDNLDPQMLGLTPAQAAQMVNYRDNYAADVPWSSGHADLKEAYKEKMLHKMLDRPQPITQTLIAHSYTDGVKRDHDSAQQYSLRFEVA